MSGSVPSSWSRGPANSVPRPMIIRPRTLKEMMAVDTVDFISWMRPAPKSWETTTLQPIERPAATATDKKTMGEGGAHRCHRVLAYEFAHHGGIHHVVELLKEVSPPPWAGKRRTAG